MSILRPVTLAAVVFDFDGVIVDSEPVHLRAYQAILEELGYTLSTDEYFDRLLGLDDRGVFLQIAADRGIDASEETLAKWIAHKTEVLQEQLSKHPRPTRGAVDCVTALARTLPLAIASGALRPEIETALDALGLRQYFPTIVAAGETSRVKPHPDPYIRAIELLHVPSSEAVAIEDSPVGIAAARSAGLAVVGLTQTYPASRLSEASAVVDSLAEVDLEFLEDVVRRRTR